MAHLDYLRSVYDLYGKDVVDVGAGDGTFSKQLNQFGATVTGIEIDSTKVENARKNLSSDISISVGRAENLPLDSQSMDLACFFYSFHHVPMDVQEQALAEVKRILRPKGRVHVVEPFPHGSMFEVARMVTDEAEVRTHSHRLMNSLGNRDDFNLIARNEYTLTREFHDFRSLVERLVRTDPTRSAILHSVRKEMEKTYHRVAREQDGKRVLDSPCAAYHFEVWS